MSSRKVGMGLSILAGLAVAGIVGVVLDVIEFPAGSAVGAFVGGLIGGWLLYGSRRRASVAGLVVGILGFPVQLSIFIALVSSELYTPPAVPEIPESVLMVALGLTLVMEIVAGTAGGLLGGVLHRPPPQPVETPRPYMPPPPPRPEKYCIQCGAGLAKETPLCPACGARQPS